MNITTKINIEVIAKEKIDKLTNEEIEEFKNRVKTDLINDLGLYESPVHSYKIDIEVEKEN